MNNCLKFRIYSHLYLFYDLYTQVPAGRRRATGCSTTTASTSAPTCSSGGCCTAGRSVRCSRAFLRPLTTCSLVSRFSRRRRPLWLELVRRASSFRSPPAPLSTRFRFLDELNRLRWGERWRNASTPPMTSSLFCYYCACQIHRYCIE